MTRRERAQFLPVMTALLRVMETDRPSPEDINTLLVLSRDLSKNIPEGQSNIFGQFGDIFGGFGGGFGLNR